MSSARNGRKQNASRIFMWVACNHVVMGQRWFSRAVTNFLQRKMGWIFGDGALNRSRIKQKITMQYGCIGFANYAILKLFANRGIHTFIQCHNHDARCSKIQTVHQGRRWKILYQTKMYGIFI